MQDGAIKNHRQTNKLKNRHKSKRTYEFDCKYWIDTENKWVNIVLEIEKIRNDLIQSILDIFCLI